MTERPTLRVAPRAWEKLWLYIRLAEGEVGGIGRVEQDGADFVMTDCFLIDQRATDVDVELDSGALSRFLIECLEREIDPSTLRLWWHSHAREAVFWSPDDERTIDRFGGEWLVSLEGNHGGKLLARLDRFEPRRETIGWLDVAPPGPPPPERGPAAALARAELDRRVSIVRRRTNKLWTDGELPKRHG
jgi:hypothetical protein